MFIACDRGSTQKCLWERWICIFLACALVMNQVLSFERKYHFSFWILQLSCKSDRCHCQQLHTYQPRGWFIAFIATFSGSAWCINKEMVMESNCQGTQSTALKTHKAKQHWCIYWRNCTTPTSIKKFAYNPASGVSTNFDCMVELWTAGDLVVRNVGEITQVRVMKWCWDFFECKTAHSEVLLVHLCAPDTCKRLYDWY